MSILDVENLTQGFGERTIFDNIDFKLLKGEHIGLVGSNGEGKSTFMKLITGKILPEEGSIKWSGKTSYGYLDQNVELTKGKTVREVLRTAYDYLYEKEKRLNNLYIEIGDLKGRELDNALKKIGTIQEYLDENNFYGIESNIDAISDGLGFRNLLERDTSSLSGGQRIKVLLGKLLLQRPDVLLLDEPTNHLDEENIEWLKNYLINYEKSFILICHDTIFLNAVVNVIYHLENKKFTRYSGNYDKFIKLYKIRKEQNQIAYIRQQKEIKSLENFIRKNIARASTTGLAQSREKKLNKISRIELNKNKVKPHFDFLEGYMSGNLIFETKDLVIGYDKPLTVPLNLRMNRGDKIVLAGANGIGKTTLLKSLLGIIKPLSGSIELGINQQIGYYEQEILEVNKSSVIDVLWDEFPKDSKTIIRRKLARCGLTSEHINSTFDKLSGGEQSKVRLCKLINKKTNILVLDEPTNHLDVDAKEELKRALKSYKGSILIVSHDKEFYESVSNVVWNCEKWAKRG